MNNRLSIILSVFTVAACLLCMASASAQVEDSVEDPWAEARELYRDGAYAGAVPYIVAAAQRDPTELRYVVSLARAHYQAGNLDKAVYYYDMYTGSELSNDASGRYSLSTARSERESANRNREGSNEPPRPPAYETGLLNSLEAQIEAGPALTTTGGGAVATWRALLRSGYVSPSLTQIRQRLADKLVREARHTLRDSAGWIPNLTLQQWQTQAERYRLAASLLPPPKPFDRDEESATPPDAGALQVTDTTLSSYAALDGWRAFCEGQIQYLNENYTSALEQFDAAAAALPQHPEPILGAMNSMIAGANRGGAASASAGTGYIDRLERLDLGDSKTELVEIYRALIESTSGNARQGARHLRSFFLSTSESSR